MNTIKIESATNGNICCTLEDRSTVTMEPPLLHEFLILHPMVEASSPTFGQRLGLLFGMKP